MLYIIVPDSVSEEEQGLEENTDQDEDGSRSNIVEPEDLTPGEPLDRILQRVEAEKEKTGEPSSTPLQA